MISIDCNNGVAAVALRTDPCALLFEIAHRFPGQPVGLGIGNETVIVFQSAAAATEILQFRTADFAKNFGPFMTYFGKSRLTTDGLDWRGQQKISQPYISGRNSDAIAALARLHYGRAAAAMRSEQDETGKLAIETHLDHAALDILLNAVFGIEEHDLGETFLADMRAILEVCAQSVWNLPGAESFHTSEDLANAKAASERIVRALDRLRADFPSRQELKDGLLARLHSAESDSLSFAAEVCTLIFAGFDTTSAALSWIMFLLARDSDLQRQLRAHIAQADAEEPRPDLAVKTPLLSAIITEALRLFPAIPLVSRFAMASRRVDDVPILRGQRVLISIIGLHHDSTNWKNPKRFDAGRFPAGTVPPGLEPCYRPFGLGQRSCGGMRFARLELALAVVTLLRELEFQAASNSPLAFTWRISMRRKGGVQLACRPAQQA